MVATLVRLLFLVLIWVSLQGTLSVGNVLLGLVFGGAILRVSAPLFDASDPAESRRLTEGIRPLRRLWRVLVLLLVFLRELVVSALQVARYTVQPTLRIRPAIVKYPLDVQTGREITLLANLISLTPGTLSLDVSPDGRSLYVHAMSVETDDGSEIIDDIKGSLEKHVRRALGPRNAD
jgi:multicomponent Na+:H+ antiporter subunit E